MARHTVDRKKLDGWDAMKAVPRNGCKLSRSLWLIIAKELLDSSGDLHHNYTGDVSVDPKRGPQDFSDAK